MICTHSNFIVFGFSTTQVFPLDCITIKLLYIFFMQITSHCKIKGEKVNLQSLSIRLPNVSTARASKLFCCNTSFKSSMHEIMYSAAFG
jgi:hypothetical protein